jgi:hypothetical protein
MRLFGISDKENELYFRIQKSAMGLDTISRIAREIFGDDGYEFESKWQSGLPEGEDFESISVGGKFMAVILGQKRIHILLKGRIDKIKIKKIISQEYDF